MAGGRKKICFRMVGGPRTSIRLRNGVKSGFRASEARFGPQCFFARASLTIRSTNGSFCVRVGPRGRGDVWRGKGVLFSSAYSIATSCMTSQVVTKGRGVRPRDGSETGIKWKVVRFGKDGEGLAEPVHQIGAVRKIAVFDFAEDG